MNKFIILSLLVGGFVAQNSFANWSSEFVNLAENSSKQISTPVKQVSIPVKNQEATFTNYCVDNNGQTIKSDKPCSEIGLKEQQFSTGLKK